MNLLASRRQILRGKIRAASVVHPALRVVFDEVTDRKKGLRGVPVTEREKAQFARDLDIAARRGRAAYEAHRDAEARRRHPGPLSTYVGAR